MLIYSENKDMLINADNIFGLYIDNNGANGKIFAQIDRDGGFCLGEYSLEEAYNILHDIMIAYGKDAKVFQMPNYKKR